jgi:hypothetical protein
MMLFSGTFEKEEWRLNLVWRWWWFSPVWVWFSLVWWWFSLL